MFDGGIIIVAESLWGFNPIYVRVKLIKMMVNIKSTYEELEKQVAEHIKQNESGRLDFAFLDQEKEKRADELSIANMELAYQNQK
jgi:hypothetical protein